MSEKEQSQHATKRPFHVSSQPSELSDLENPFTHRNKAVKRHLASNVPYGLFPIFTVSVFGTRALQTCLYASTCCSPCSKYFFELKIQFLKIKTVAFLDYFCMRRTDISLKSSCHDILSASVTSQESFLSPCQIPL